MYFNLQGWGNRKGETWIQPMRPTSSNTTKECISYAQQLHNKYDGECHCTEMKSELVVEHRNTFGIAPHKSENATKTLTRDDNVLEVARCGDYFRFMKNIGGGGGHELEIRNFKVILQHGCSDGRLNN